MSDIDDLHPDLRALVGQVIHERYRVEGLLGRGGMGAVFKAHHMGLRRDLAIKVLRPEIGRDPSTAKRFDREAHSVSRLDHRNCVRVTDFGTTEGGVKYLVMELLEGGELEAELGQPWAPIRAIDTIIQVLEGLEHAHHFGIVHRDLKPENVFVTRDFRGDEIIKLVDFGIAKLIDAEGAKEQLTRAGMVFGTPRYMSPEQASGGKLDERTDLYATGLILYQMLAGHPPFEADDAALLLRMHILADPPALPPSVPEPLARVVAKLLEKSRNDRHASAREVIDELAALRPALVAASAATPTVTPPSAAPLVAPRPAALPVAAPPPAAPPPAASPPAAPPASSTPSMATHAEPAAGASAWQPAAPVTAPTHAHNRVPNAPTYGHDPQARHPGHPGMAAITTFDPVLPARVPAKNARPWLVWVVGAGAVMLALMAFGAGQALQSKTAAPAAGFADNEGPGESRSQPLWSAPAGDAAALTNADMDCVDGDCECHHLPRCELECAYNCTVRCTDAERCEITVDNGSSVFCDRFGSCEVQCLGDCEVQCPQGQCDVECPARPDKHGKLKRKKPKQCGDVYLCGSDCNGKHDDD